MSSNSPHIEFPSIAESLYKASSIEEARDLYISELRKTGTLPCLQYAAKLTQCKRMLSIGNLKGLERDFIAFKEHMRIWSKKTGIPLILQRRQKDYLGLNAKIRLFLSTRQSLSKINDLLGFRIILKTPYPDSELSIQHCYQVLNETISFFALKKNCLILEAEPRTGHKISAEKAKKIGIVIPKQDYILEGFKINVKDYVLSPKENGYQSLHILISTPSGIIFEVQIRTSFMDVIAEHGSGKHSMYKKARYQNSDMNVDYAKIHMPGFMILSTGECYDIIGLQHSVDPFNIL